MQSERKRSILFAMDEILEEINPFADSPSDFSKSPGVPEPEEEKIRKLFKTKTAEATFLLANRIAQKYHVISVVASKDKNEIYTYEDGKYSRTDHAVIFRETQRVLGPLTTRNAKMETLHKVVDATQAAREIFEKTPRTLIPVKNGVYSYKSKTLLPHFHGVKNLFQFPVKYEEAATCPKILKFLGEVLRERDIPLIQEIAGYLFYRKYTYKKAIILIGEMDTGKTTLISLLIALLGRDNIAGVSLQKIAGDKFSAANLYAKHANFVDDLSSSDVSETGNFKQVCGGGMITGEHKFGAQFSFENYAKLFFACNRIPEVNQPDDPAYYGRWIIVRFDKPVKEKKIGLIEELTGPEELSGFFNWAMDGLRRLLKENKFSNEKSHEENRTEMMLSASSIAHFAASECTHDPNAEINRTEIYDLYISHCLAYNLPTETQERFSRRFSFYCGYAADGQAENWSASGKRMSVKVWRGVRVKNQVAGAAKEEDGEDNF